MRKDNTNHTVRTLAPWLLRTLSFLSLLLSLPACFATIHFFSRGLPGDKDGGIASALIAILLIAASIIAMIKARSLNLRAIPETGTAVKSSSLVISIVAIPIGLLSIWGSVLCLWDAAELINQEYLNWFPVHRRRSFGDTSISAMIWGEFIPMGIFTAAVGLFLLWFVGRSFLRRIGQSQSSSLVDPSNPYSAPST